MRIQPFVIILTGINLVLLLWLILAGSGAATGQSTAPVLRARVIELVDDTGQVRAQLNVESNGETIFRMRDAKGDIRVKLGASEEGSGLLLADESAQPGLHILAKRGSTTVTLTDRSDQQRMIRPSEPEP